MKTKSKNKRDRSAIEKSPFKPGDRKHSPVRIENQNKRNILNCAICPNGTGYWCVGCMIVDRLLCAKRAIEITEIVAKYSMTEK